MQDAIRRYLTLLVAAVIVGVVGGHAVGLTHTTRAVPGPLLSLAERPLVALVAAAAAVAIMAVVAVVAARVVNSAVGLFVLGWGIGVMAMRSGTVVDLAFLAGAAPLRIGIETLLWSALVGAASLAIWRIGGPLRDMPRPDDEHNGIVSAVRGPHALRGVAAALVAIPVIWLMTRTTMVGQTLGAATLAGMAAGVLSRMWAPRVQPVFVAPVAIAAIGVAQCAIAISASVQLEVGVILGSVPGPLRAMPMGIAGGVVAGVALGIGWARSFATLGPEDDESLASGPAKPLPSARTA